MERPLALSTSNILLEKRTFSQAFGFRLGYATDDVGITVTLNQGVNNRSIYFRQYVRTSSKVWVNGNVVYAKPTAWHGDNLVSKPGMPGMSPTQFLNGIVKTTDSPGGQVKLATDGGKDVQKDGMTYVKFQRTGNPATQMNQVMRNQLKLLILDIRRFGRDATENAVWCFQTYVLDTATQTPIGYITWGFTIQWYLDKNGSPAYRLLDLKGATKQGTQAAFGLWQWHQGVEQAVWDTWTGT